MAVGVGNMRQVTGDTRHVTHNTWQLMILVVGVSMLLSTHVKRFSASRMRDFYREEWRLLDTEGLSLIAEIRTGFCCFLLLYLSPSLVTIQVSFTAQYHSTLYLLFKCLSYQNTICKWHVTSDNGHMIFVAHCGCFYYLNFHKLGPTGPSWS